MNRFLLVFMFIGIFHNVHAQSQQRDSIIEVLDAYSMQSKNKELKELSINAQKGLSIKNEADSLYAAQLYYYEAESQFLTWNVPVLRKLFNRAMDMCPKSDEGQLVKVNALKASVFMEAPQGFELEAYNKSKQALSILQNLNTEPPADTLLEIYSCLAILTTTFGNTDKRKEYFREAKRLITKNDFNSDVINGYYITMIMSLYKTDTEEREILYYLDLLEQMPNKADVRYFEASHASSLYRITEYYHKSYENGNKNALTKGREMANKIIKLYGNDDFLKFHVKVARYFLCEFLIAENRLDEALSVNNKLLSEGKSNDRRMKYELAQKTEILLKLNRLDDAQSLLDQTLKEFHSGKEELDTTFSNFTTSPVVDYTTIFLDLSDEFNIHSKGNLEIKKIVNRLNRISLDHFERSIENKLSSNKINNLFERIIANLISETRLETKGKLSIVEILERVENMENTLDWQEFLQQRDFDELKFIDEFKTEELALSNALVAARTEKQDSVISSLELKLEQLKKDLQTQHPNITRYSSSDFIAADFQRSMKKEEVTLRYENVMDTLYAFVISHDKIELSNLGASGPILKIIQEYLNNIKNRTDATYDSQKLYSILIPQKTSDFNHINIVPDEYLYKLPFETLMDKDGNYLIENKPVIYAPYLSLLKYNNKADSIARKDEAKIMIFTPNYEGIESNNEVTVRGNEYRLDGAKEESRLIAQLFPNTAFSDHAATKDNFKRYAPDGQLLHLSMHASLNPTTPELSHLIFTQGNSDNKLYLQELYGMNLSADMAVLSACNTGVGNFEVDKGIVSLHRAFNQSGIPTTVSSLWEAPDVATQSIMVDFYKQLKLGKTKAQSLRTAKLNYLKNTKDNALKAPFYWAGFVINGTNDPITSLASDNYNYLWWLGGLFFIAIALLVYFLFFKRK